MSGIVSKNGGRSSGIVGAGAIGADAVDGSNIADDAIDSEHYAAGSIDEAHIADNAVTLAKMAGGTDGQIITFDASGNPSAVGPGSDGEVLTSTGAGSPPAFEAASGGDKRNYILDGAVTQWPEGTAAVAGTGYKSALCKVTDGSSGSLTGERSTDIPTVAQSSFQGSYSLLLKCTGTEASMSAANYTTIDLFVTGSDFTHLHQQQMTFSFWAKTAAANSGDNYNVTIMNSAANRNYIFTFAPSSSWTKFTFTFTGDTSGTWLFTEADIGMRIRIALASGTDYDDGTEGSWTAGHEQWSSSGTAIGNFMDSTSNEFYITQIQLVLGATSPNFTSPPISTVINQVQYYVQDLLNGDSDQILGSGQHIGASADNAQLRVAMHWQKKRINNSTISTHSTTTYYNVVWENNENDVSSITGIYNIGPTGCDFRVNHAGAATVGYGGLARSSNASATFLIDARH